MTNEQLAPWMTIASSYLGTKEIPGAKNNPVIMKFFKEAGHDEIESELTSWCSAFINAVLFEYGVEGTKNLLARSWLKWSGGKRVIVPRYGDIAVFKRGNSSWEGHVAFFEKWDDDRIYVLGGNQGNAVSHSSQPRSALLGFIRPNVAPADSTPVVPDMVTKVDYKPTPQDLAVAGGSAASVMANTSGILLIVALVAIVAVLGFVLYKRSKA